MSKGRGEPRGNYTKSERPGREKKASAGKAQPSSRGRAKKKRQVEDKLKEEKKKSCVEHGSKKESQLQGEKARCKLRRTHNACAI